MRIVLGTMAWGSPWHGRKPVDERAAASLLDLAVERGVEWIDTADVYGRGAAESMLGRLLGKRRVKVATKVLGELGPGTGGLGRKWIMRAVEGSLKRLRRERIDLYMPHGWDPEVPLAETWEALTRLKEAGKVAALGVSNYNGGMLRQALALGAPIESNQLQYSLAVRQAERDRVDGVALHAWSPLGGGWLTGSRPEFPAVRNGAALAFVLAKVAQLERVTPAQAALGWVLGRADAVVIGPRTPQQLAELLDARPLSARAETFVERACSVL